MKNFTENPDNYIDNTGEGSNAIPNYIVALLSDEAQEIIRNDEKAMKVWIHDTVDEIIQEHASRLCISVDVTYVDAPLDMETTPFQMVDNGKETGTAEVKIQYPNHKDKLSPIMYPHIIHHELSHIYNEDYYHLVDNTVSEESIAKMNDIDDEYLFSNLHIHSGLNEVVTDLIALQMQEFTINSRISFLATVEWFLDTGEKMESKTGLFRDIIRFRNIIIGLKDRFPSSSFADSLLTRLDVIYGELEPLLHDIQKKELSSMEQYIQQLCIQFYDKQV